MVTYNNLPKIIGFSGKIGSGKTTLAQILCNEYPYTKASFADPLKYIVQYLYDLEHNQLYGNKKEIIDTRYGVTPRYLLQYIGTNLFRNWDKNFWVNVFERKYANQELLVLDDVRFENEAHIIHQMGGIVIKVVSHRVGNNNIDNNNIGNNNTDQNGINHIPANHESEQGVKNYDYKIYNDQGYEELNKSLQELLHYIKTNNSNNNENNHADEEHDCHLLH